MRVDLEAVRAAAHDPGLDTGVGQRDAYGIATNWMLSCSPRTMSNVGDVKLQSQGRSRG